MHRFAIHQTLNMYFSNLCNMSNKVLAKKKQILTFEETEVVVGLVFFRDLDKHSEAFHAF